MLSHLRFHRRGGHSSPNSPDVDEPSSSPFGTQPSPNSNDGGFIQSGDGSYYQQPQQQQSSPSNSAGMPPMLPPITRVTSDDPLSMRLDETESPKIQPAQRSPYEESRGFIGGVALRKYQREAENRGGLGQSRSTDNLAALRSADAAKSAGNAGNTSFPLDAGHGSPINSNLLSPNPNMLSPNSNMLSPSSSIMSPTNQPPSSSSGSYKAPSSFSTPTDLQTSARPTGRRQPGARVNDEPAVGPAPANQAEPQKTKRGLPFLKNPMSTLLARRKNNQNAPEAPPPITTKVEEPKHDFVFRGTRVHDFSAPRTKTKPPIPMSQSTSQLNLQSERERRMSRDSAPSRGRQLDDPLSAPQSARSGSASTMSQLQPTSGSVSSQQTSASLVESQVPLLQREPTSPSIYSQPSKASRISTRENAPPSASNSFRAARSRGISLTDKDGLSSIPRHMKSTSSRFSFDMMSSNNQEKEMEERHRQKAMEKGVSDPRDSRFDEYDEDEFDYDAMMNDDYGEEEIPMIGEEDDIPMIGEEEEEIPMVGEEEEILMVGEEEEIPTVGIEDEVLDPDNDQENFAGFVFQRSNSVSSTATPQSAGFVTTPRDVEGNVIGFAMSKDSPNANVLTAPPNLIPPTRTPPGEPVATTPGLGIQGMDVNPFEADLDATPRKPGSTSTHTAQRAVADDLYFDNGLTGYEDEFAEDLAAAPGDNGAAPFDESIFDLDDTDQYGRPLPGAFAQAQSLRNAQLSGLTRNGTGLMAAPLPTMTSSGDYALLDAASRLQLHENGSDAAFSKEQSFETSKAQSSGNPMASYQAALAAAALAAEQSGKFERESPNEVDETTKELKATPDLPLQTTEPPVYENLDDYEQGYEVGYEDMDDYDGLDDSYVTEANGMALANDSDGWYGQEFGFYSALANAHHNNAHHNTAPSGETEYENALGGVFGPKGMNGLDRSQSGRMISREPNLTPITERSEYSNRNSIMSFGMPALNSGTPMLQTSGLAQLAMMTGGDDDMTLSALLKLRSKAWGGSQISLNSSREGSPRSERGEERNSLWGQNPMGLMAQHTGQLGARRRRSSAYSDINESEPPSAPGSPTLTMDQFTALSPTGLAPDAVRDSMLIASPQPHPHPIQTNILSSLDPNEPPLSAVSGTSSVEWPRVSGQNSKRASLASQRPRVGHKHKNSAESISYRQEEEEGGETRWVMERTRTGETGEVEIEREVVEGGRI